MNPIWPSYFSRWVETTNSELKGATQDVDAANTLGLTVATLGAPVVSCLLRETYQCEFFVELIILSWKVLYDFVEIA